MKGVSVPITPSVLRWAIDSSGYSPRDVAAHLHVPAETIDAWLAGNKQPTLTKFRQLANFIKRTPSTLLLPEPPLRSYPAVKFRHPVGEERSELNPAERRFIREATRIQRILRWVATEIADQSPRLPTADTRADGVEAVACQTRSSLGITDEMQTAWKSGSQAFEAWRMKLEEKGILIFALPLGEGSCRGFSLWDEIAPVVTVNTAWNTEARIFSLLHEYGHLLTRTDSACAEDGLAEGSMREEDRVERWCERFSAAVLMPKSSVEHFLRELGAASFKFSTASLLAKHFKVSLRAAVIRLVELNLAGWDLYRQIPSKSDKKRTGGGGKGRNRFQVRKDQLGRRTMRLFLRALENDVLTRTDILGILNIADSDLETLQDSGAG